MFKRLDLYLLDRVFEPLARVLNRKVGLSNYTLAKWFLMFATAFMAFSAYAWIRVGSKNGGSTFLLMVAMDLLYIWPALRTSVRMEREYSNPVPGRLPPNFRDPDPFSSEERLVQMRRYGLDIVLILVLVTAYVLGIEAFSMVDGRGYVPIEGGLYSGFFTLLKTSWVTGTVGMYFLACTPLYPREKTEAASLVLQPAPIKN